MGQGLLRAVKDLEGEKAREPVSLSLSLSPGPVQKGTHVLGPADGGGVDEAPLQVAVPEEAVVRLRARASVPVVNNLCSA